MRYLAAFLVCLVGCSVPVAPSPVGHTSSGLYTVVVTPSEGLGPDVAWAVSEWQAAGAAVVVGERGVCVRYGTPHYDRLGELYDGCIILRHSAVERMTLLHELGHVLGVPHLSSGLMVESYSGVTYECIDALAAEAIGGTPTCNH